MNIAVVFGGKSTEHDISCISAAFILSLLSEHTVCKIGITRDGQWYRTTASEEDIKTGAWTSLPNEPVDVSLNKKAFVYSDTAFCPDVIFPVLHGKNGEDGTVQGLFELMGIPYVGCRVLGSALCMDKIAAKAAFAAAGIRQVPYVTAERGETLSSIVERAQALQYPVFVKPANAGSSIGITKCTAPEQVPDALQQAFEVDRRVVIEQGLMQMKEVEVAVLGNDKVVTSVTGMIRPANDFYDFEAKYVSENSALIIPSGLEQEPQLREIAEKAYRACDCKGLARVDFMIAPDGKIYLNEINTLPGFTQISMYPKLFEASGIPARKLVDTLLSLALEFKND